MELCRLHARLTFLMETTINSYILDRKTNFRDLGVDLQSNMKCNNRYSRIVKKAYKVLGFIFRNSKYFVINTTIRIYNAIVRSHLEYASVIYGHLTQSLIQIL